MSRSFATACALGALLLAGPVLAQTRGAGGPAAADETIRALSPAPETRTGGGTLAEGAQPADPGRIEVETVEVEDAGPALEGGFIARQGENHLMASELMDADVMTSADESLGKVEDMLVDARGRILGVVVGVGGFLGMGQKQVAIPIQSVEVVYEGDAGETLDAGAQPPQPGGGLALTGGTDIAHILVDFSRDELEQAPTFARLDEQDAEGRAEGEPVEATGATNATGQTPPPPAREAPRAQ